MECQAWSLLRRYGIVFRRLLTRESGAAPWRELTRVYRRLEARGEIRGGRFVAGFTGEKYALPDAFTALGAVTSRALIIGLGYTLIWEGVLAGLLEGTKFLSVRQAMLGVSSDSTALSKLAVPLPI